MNALFLAGGKGTRLRPLTDHLPKPMVPVMGRPLLERNLEDLRKCGISEAVFSTCYRADDIQKYFSANDGQGTAIQYVCEDIPLGTGGAIKNCANYFDDTFLIFNSDIVCNLDLRDLIRFHKAKQADVTIAATRVSNPSNYGVIEYDEFGFATSFTEKPKPGEEKSDFINAGIYVFEPKILKLIPSNRVVSVEKIFPALLQNGYKIAVYRGGTYWIDIGTPEKYMRVHADIFSGLCRVPENNFMANKVFASGKTEIHGTAKVVGPVWLGDHVRIGANVTIGPNVVVGNGFESGRGCVISNSILWDDVSIGSGVSISKSVVTAGCHIGSGIQCTNTIYSRESKRHLVI